MIASGYPPPSAKVATQPPNNEKSKTVELVKTSYQPTKAELNEEFQIDAPPEEIGDALLQPVKVRWIDKPRTRRTRA